MAKIPGIIYICVGIMFMVASYILDAKRETSKLTFFIFIGAFMVLMGLVKWAISMLKKSPKKEKSSAKPVYCGVCGSALRSFDNFCNKCGNRIFGS